MGGVGLGVRLEGSEWGVGRGGGSDWGVGLGDRTRDQTRWLVKFPKFHFSLLRCHLMQTSFILRVLV